MASEVDICNVALGNLGDDATVASLDPPEGSAQAEHCARFYPIARDLLLDSHNWTFNTRRAPLALLVEAPPSAWRYAYASPPDILSAIAVLDPLASDDNSVGMPAYGGNCGAFGTAGGIYTPQNFTTEVDDVGATVIYTNQADAVLRYTARVTDSTKFSPRFTHALTLMLASMLAGPVLKGETGIKAAALWLDRAEKAMAKASAGDANQQRQEIAQNTSWLANR